jgi:hypothetical protein
MLLPCSYPRMAPIYFVSKTMNTCTRQLSVVALLTPMNHSLQGIIVSSACEEKVTLKCTPTVRWCRKD